MTFSSKFALTVALVLTMALTFSCSSPGGGGNGGGGSSLNGTWKSNEGMDIKLNNGSFEVLFDNKAGLRGTYTSAAGNTVITFVVKEVHGDYLNDERAIFESKWYNKNQVLDVLKKWVKELNPNLTDSEISDWLGEMSAALDEEPFKTETGIIDGNTMIDGDGNTYTKTTGSSGNGGS